MFLCATLSVLRVSVLSVVLRKFTTEAPSSQSLHRGFSIHDLRFTIHVLFAVCSAVARIPSTPNNSVSERLCHES